MIHITLVVQCWIGACQGCGSGSKPPQQTNPDPTQKKTNKSTDGIEKKSIGKENIVDMSTHTRDRTLQIQTVDETRCKL